MFLYIDPNTGGMITALLVVLASTWYLFLQKIVDALKIKKAKPVQQQEKVDCIIFSDSGRYWSTFKKLCQLFDENEIKIEYWTCSDNDPALKEKFKFVHTRYIGDIDKALNKLNTMNAKICISTTPNLETYQWKRSNNVEEYAHIFHAVTDIHFYKMFSLDFYDTILTSSSFQRKQIRKLEKMRGQKKKRIKDGGLPYMDDLLERSKTATSNIKFNNEKKTVLIASTWGDAGILKKYGEELIDKIVSGGYNIIIRPHPQSFTNKEPHVLNMEKKYSSTENVLFDKTSDPLESMITADVMIADYSGIIYDYMFLLNKPVIYADTSFSGEQYEYAWLGDTTWSFDALNKMPLKLTKNTKEGILFLIEQSQKENISKLIDEMKDEAWLNQGYGAETIFAYIKDRLDGKEIKEDEEDMASWQKIWNQKELNGSLSEDEFKSYCILKKMNGFDVAVENEEKYFCAFYNEWISVYETIKDKFHDKIESVYEVGCGSGVNLYMYKQRGVETLGGCDYGKNMVEQAKKTIQNQDADIKNISADSIDVNEKYDVVMAEGVFQYFPDEKYARDVLRKMIEKCNKAVYIGDINDKAKEELLLRKRRKEIENYDERYEGLEKLALKKSMFKAEAKSAKCKIQIFEPENEQYVNNGYNFSCIIWKE